jgi:hypothetical protein
LAKQPRSKALEASASSEVTRPPPFQRFANIPNVQLLKRLHIGKPFAQNTPPSGARTLAISYARQHKKEVLLDRPVSFTPSAPQPSASGKPRRSLKTFDMTVQAYGVFFKGYPWQIFGCGTYRAKLSDERASKLLTAHFDRLRKSIKAPVAYLAIPERRRAGLGYSPIDLHWHFVMSVPPQHTMTTLHNARCFWEKHYGNAKIELYDDAGSGAHYLAKLAGQSDFDYAESNLKRLSYNGPADLFEHFQRDPYVPDHVRHRTSGKTLLLRAVRGNAK